MLVTSAPGDEFTLELSPQESCEAEQAKVTLLRISLQVGPAVKALTKAPCGNCNVQQRTTFFPPVSFFFQCKFFSFRCKFFYKHAEMFVPLSHPPWELLSNTPSCSDPIQNIGKWTLRLSALGKVK